MRNPLLSVVIPVYMVQDYLDECIRSVVNQTYKNLEIILVDDGSKDDSPRICDAWQKLDCRIRVIHKENGGVSSARNAGLSVSTGEFIAFVDSDDWLSPDCYQKVIDYAISTKADIVGYDIFETYPDRVVSRSHIPMTLPEVPFRAADYLPALIDMWPLAWAKVYRKDFIVYRGLSFLEGLIWEDNAFMMGCWVRNPLVAFIREPLHYYRLGRDGQISYGFNAKTLDIFDVLKEIHGDFDKNGMNAYRQCLIDWSVRNVFWLYRKTPFDSRDSYFLKMRHLFFSYVVRGWCLPGFVKKRTLMTVFRVLCLSAGVR